MRIVVLVLALLGCAAAGYVAFGWFQFLLDPGLEMDLGNDRTRISRKPGVVAEKVLQEAKDHLAKYEAINVTGYFMLAALPFGLAGGVLGFMRRGLIAGPLLLVVVPGPIICVLIAPGGAPSEIMLTVLLSMAPFLVGGVLAFFVWQRPPILDEEPESAPRSKVAVEGGD
jgi:hypothetical protein